MFERYTETARRAIFFARYEAGQAGCDEIESEHLLLGILRMDSALALRLFGAPEKIQAVRESIEKRQHPPGKAPNLSVDLPLSHECKRALAFANKDAEELQHKHIAAEHLLLGLFREEKCLAAKILREHGINLPQLQEEAASREGGGATAAPPADDAPLAVGYLTAAARHGALGPLVGREPELDRVMQILSRRSRNNVALAGEPGVGKTTVVDGLAQRIADGTAPPALAERAVLTIDAATLFDAKTRAKPGNVVAWATAQVRPILCVEGLLDAAAAAPAWSVVEAAHLLEVLAAAGVACIATGTPSGLRRTAEKAGAIARHFEVVELLPPDEAETAKILLAIKPHYERFHGVVYGEGVVEAAVRASRLFLPHRYLPERAIDLMDEAGARVRLREQSEPPEFLALQKHIRLHSKSMEDAIAKHEFAKARQHSEEERKARLELQRLREERQPAPSGNTVTPSDVEEVVAVRAGMPLAAVESVLKQSHPERLQVVALALAGRIPPEGHEWLRFLAAYLADCSPEDAELLAQAIRAARAAIGG